MQLIEGGGRKTKASNFFSKLREARYKIVCSHGETGK